MNLAKEFHNFQVENCVNSKVVAKSINVSYEEFSKLLTTANNEKFTNSLKTYMSNFSKKIELIQDDKIGFVNVSQVEDALFSIELAIIDKEIAVITGEAGVGKSTIIEHFIENEEGAVLIQARESISPKVLLKEICKKVGATISGALDEMLMSIVNQIKESDKVIFIDEAEHLTYKSLELLRKIWDFTHRPIVLVGTPPLLDNLIGEDDKYKQLWTRIGGGWELKGLTKDDTIKVFESVGIELNSEFLNMIYQVTMGNFRATIKLIKKLRGVMRYNKTQELSKSIVAKAIKVLVFKRK